METVWDELHGKQLRYHDRTWELTGTVDVRKSGELLVVEARQADDVKHERAMLSFGLEEPPQSLNPGNLENHFDHLEQDGEAYVIVVKKSPRTYRYRLRRLKHT